MTGRLSNWLLLIVVAWLVLYPLGWLFAPVLDGEAAGRVAEILTSRLTYEMIGDTLLLGASVTIFATAVGTALAWLSTATQLRFRYAIDVLMILPLIIPPFVMGMAWIFLAGPQAGLLNNVLESLGIGFRFNIFSMPGLIWVIGLHTMPYVYLNVKAGVLQLDSSVEEAARASGAGWFATLRHVTLPLLLPSIGAGALLAFIVTAEMFGVPKLIGQGTGTTVLSLGIYDSLKYPSDFVQAAVLALLMLAIAVALTAAYRRMLLAQEGRYATVGARGARAAGRIALPGQNFVSVLVLLFLGTAVVLPTAVLVLASFTPVWTGRIDFSNLSLDVYRSVLSLDLMRRGLVNSILFSIVATIIAIALGTAIAYVSLRSRWRFKGLLDYLAALPFTLPGMALGVGLLIAYLRPPVLYGTAALMILAFVTRYIAIAVRNGMSALAQVDRAMEEAARAAGARSWRLHVHIVVPLIAASTIGTSTLLVAAIVREMSASILLYSYGTEVLTVAMFSVWESGDLAQATAIGVIMTVIVLALAGIGRLLARRRSSALTMPPG